MELSLIIDNRLNLQSVYVDGQEALLHTVEEPGVDAIFVLGEGSSMLSGSRNRGETMSVNIPFLFGYARPVGSRCQAASMLGSDHIARMLPRVYILFGMNPLLSVLELLGHVCRL